MIFNYRTIETKIFFTLSVEYNKYFIDMEITYLKNESGSTTAVQIPIDDWNVLKQELDFIDQESEKVPDWQIEEVERRLNNYYNNQSNTSDAFEALDRIRKNIYTNKIKTVR